MSVNYSEALHEELRYRLDPLKDFAFLDWLYEHAPDTMADYEAEFLEQNPEYADDD